MEWDDIRFSHGESSAHNDRSTAHDIDMEEELPGITEYFPDAVTTFGAGHTFLSLFNCDENSVYRKTNLYYLFSCKKDWEIASWLLCSGLSMGKIDTFLSLEMVSSNCCPSQLHANNVLRLRILLCHFTWPRNYEDEQKCYPVVHTGCRR